MDRRGEDLEVLYEKCDWPAEFLRDPSSWLEAEKMESLLRMIDTEYGRGIASEEGLIVSVGHQCKDLRAWGVLDSVLRMVQAPKDLFAQPERLLSYFVSPAPPVGEVRRGPDFVSFVLPVSEMQFPRVTSYLRAALEALPTYINKPMANVVWDNSRVTISWSEQQASLFGEGQSTELSLHPELVRSILINLESSQKQLEEMKRELIERELEIERLKKVVAAGGDLLSPPSSEGALGANPSSMSSSSAHSFAASSLASIESLASMASIAPAATTTPTAPSSTSEAAQITQPLLVATSTSTTTVSFATATSLISVATGEPRSVIVDVPSASASTANLFEPQFAQLAKGVSREFAGPLAQVLNELYRLGDYLARGQQLITLLIGQGRQTPQVQEAMRRVDWSLVSREGPRVVKRAVASLQGIQGSLRDLHLVAGSQDPHSNEIEVERGMSDLNELVERAIESARNRIAESEAPQKDAVAIDFQRLLEHPVLLNPRRMERALENVLVNAIEASEPGAVIRVVTRPRASRVEVEITDSGCGMDEATRSRATEPFFTTKPAPAAGLGLSVAHSIVAMHAGHLSISSQPGQGSTVLFDLPLTN